MIPANAPICVSPNDCPSGYYCADFSIGTDYCIEACTL